MALAVLLAASGLVLAAPPAQSSTAGLARFESQAIAWHDCRTGPEDEVGAQLAAVGARCGELTVPLDYGDPGGRTISVAVARRAATDAGHRRGTLVVNTGGPGPSLDGVPLLVRGEPPAFPQGSPAVAAQYDLVGIDPRFFGRSTPLECGWPTGLYLHSAQLSSATRQDFDRGVATARDLAARCAGHRDELPHGSTRAIARDLDVVRAALGEQRISYLGWSYGSYLGAVYLQLFPDHADRIVLDSAIAPEAYGPALTRETAPADAAALRDWAGWAADHHQQYGLGETTDGVLAAVDQIYRAATRHPLQVGSHQVDASMIPGLLLTVDDSEASYAEFSAQVRVLREAARGLAVTPTPDLEQKLALYNDPGVSAAFGFSAATANRCADRAAPRDPETYFRDIQAHLAAEPLYGALARQITPCAFWPTLPAEAPTRIGNSHPALIVGASGDPVTPRPGQQAMHQALTGSRMVTLDHAFRHGVYLSGASGCVDTTVDRYLLRGVLPSTDIACSRGTG
ncbi:alpha/beta hydrolase [Kutzneria viridogrisea]|uniref:Pimeloyl-ACP methyl ester carboxylesterase n=1 Tax=Kutzneria viridogrisea TaxID=47990 RepID=A0ABR6BLZ3_9PSEU|nr:pimeloyl-ACP methyl ester carboxylesterase [Kutzneria viridogrisea]